MAAKRSEVSMSNIELPLETLISQAEQQRSRIHNDIADLRSSLRQAMDAKKLARENLRPALGIAGIVGLIAGYSFAGMFVRD